MSTPAIAILLAYYTTQKLTFILPSHESNYALECVQLVCKALHHSGLQDKHRTIHGVIQSSDPTCRSRHTTRDQCNKLQLIKLHLHKSKCSCKSFVAYMTFTAVYPNDAVIRQIKQSARVCNTTAIQEFFLVPVLQLYCICADPCNTMLLYKFYTTCGKLAGYLQQL